jgi:hypothetical protein
MKTNKSYSGSVAFTKLKSAITTTAKGTKCLLIPIDDNHLYEKDGAVYLPIRLTVFAEKNQFNDDGLIAQTLSSEEYKALGPEEAKKIELPILGNFRNFDIVQNDNSGVVSNEVYNGVEDPDLPF